MTNKRVGGRLWGDVCREWRDNFAKMCVYAWQTGQMDSFTGRSQRAHGLVIMSHDIRYWWKHGTPDQAVIGEKTSITFGGYSQPNRW